MVPPWSNGPDVTLRQMLSLAVSETGLGYDSAMRSVLRPSNVAPWQRWSTSLIVNAARSEWRLGLNEGCVGIPDF